MFSHPRCLLGLLYLQCHELHRNFSEPESATSRNEAAALAKRAVLPVLSAGDRAGWAQNLLSQCGVVAGGRWELPKAWGTTMFSRAPSASITLVPSYSLLALVGGKNSKMLILWEALSCLWARISSSAELCFSHTLSSGSNSLALIHCTVRHSAPRGSSECDRSSSLSSHLPADVTSQPFPGFRR